MKILQIFVSGKVQGVGFRYFVNQNAIALNLKGFTRNLKDGRVEVVAKGDENQLQSLISVLKKGNSISNVDDLEINEISSDEKFLNFEIRR